MHEFSIKDVERMSGIKAHTLRIWEYRHGLVMPIRKGSKHRSYTNDDLKSILRVAWLYHQGYKISQIARLDPTAISALIDQQIESGEYFKDAIGQMMQASKAFDTEGLEAALQRVILQLGLEQAALQVFYPFLQKLGLLWMNDQLLPAQEHIASLHIRNAIIRGIDALPRSPGNHLPILLFMPQEERHEVPILFIHYLLKSHGYHVLYFGGQDAEVAIKEYLQTQEVAQLHYHQITNFTGVSVAVYLQNWCSAYPQLRMVMSGNLTAEIESPPANATLLKSMQQLLDYCRKPFLINNG